MRGRIVSSLQPLLVPHVQHVRGLLDTRLARLTWTSPKLGATVAEIRETIRQLEVLIVRSDAALGDGCSEGDRMRWSGGSE